MCLYLSKEGISHGDAHAAIYNFGLLPNNADQVHCLIYGSEVQLVINVSNKASRLNTNCSKLRPKRNIDIPVCIKYPSAVTTSPNAINRNSNRCNILLHSCVT